MAATTPESGQSVAGSALGLRAEGAPPTVEEIACFVGKNQRVYRDFWQGALGNGRFCIRFNMAAAAFTLFWLLYRRLYREYCVIFVLLAVLGAALRSIQLDPIYLPMVLLTSQLLLSSLLGLFGNGLYLRRLRIDVVRARRISDVNRPPFLVACGRTSALAVVLGLLFKLGLSVLLGLLT